MAWLLDTNVLVNAKRDYYGGSSSAQPSGTGSGIVVTPLS